MEKEKEVEKVYTLSDVERAYAFGMLVGMEKEDGEDRIDWLCKNLTNKWDGFKKYFLKQQ